MDARRLITAMLVAFTVYMAYMWVYSRYFAPRPVPRDPDAPAVATDLAPAPPGAPSASTSPAAFSATPAATQQYSFASAPERTVKLGGEPGDALEVLLTSRGAGVERVLLTERTRKGAFRHRVSPKDSSAYELLHPVAGPQREFHAFETGAVWIKELDNRRFALDTCDWTLVEPVTPRSATFEAVLRSAEGDAPLLAVRKTYTLQTQPGLLNMALEAVNLAGQPLTIQIEQYGALGIATEISQYDTIRLVWGRRAADAVTVENVQRGSVKGLDQAEKKLAGGQDEARFQWVALANHYFTAVLRPLPAAAAAGPGPVQAAYAKVLLPAADKNQGDLTARLLSTPLPLAAGATARIDFEIYAGPKDPDDLKRANPAFADPAQIGYSAIRAADMSCACTFEPLPSIMAWLLETIHMFVRNYGLAIIGLVLIVRTLLHPLAVFQQKSMYRMQEAMAKIQPKMEAIKERYANDKVRMNQEVMKLWAEEHVNPAATLVAFVPLFLQMPILVALWAALQRDINLRTAPFDGWWIRDLSAPDALIQFAAPIHIPVLSWLIGDIHSFNLLPILMGVSMYLQQKYMPKPAAVKARLEAAKGKPRKPGEMSFEDQMRQQQMMANMMTFLFPIMFYHMPSGLNLYWMATNVYGICESLIIRRQIDAEHKRREAAGPQPARPRKPGFFARLMKKLAERAEEIQRQADELAKRK